MNPNVIRLLRDVQECYATCIVTDEATEAGGERVMQYVQRELAGTLANFIVQSKLLDGTDPSGFDMARRYDMLATEYRVRAIVLTPNELRTLLQAAFDLGERHAEAVSSTNHYNFHSTALSREALSKAVAESLDRAIMSAFEKK